MLPHQFVIVSVLTSNHVVGWMTAVSISCFIDCSGYVVCLMNCCYSGFAGFCDDYVHHNVHRMHTCFGTHYSVQPTSRRQISWLEQQSNQFQFSIYLIILLGLGNSVGVRSRAYRSPASSVLVCYIPFVSFFGSMYRHLHW